MTSSNKSCCLHILQNYEQLEHDVISVEVNIMEDVLRTCSPCDEFGDFYAKICPNP
jgi:hypothetical protein